MSKFNKCTIDTISLLVALEYEPEDITADTYIYISSWDGIVGCLKPNRSEKKEDEIGLGFYIVDAGNLLRAQHELKAYYDALESGHSNIAASGHGGGFPSESGTL